MTTVLVIARSPRRMRVEGILRWAVLVCLASGLPAAAQDRPVHWLHAGAMPPGAIGSLRLHRGRPLLGYFQPVQIRAPQGARIALGLEASSDASPLEESQPQDTPTQLLVGMQIGSVYRLTVTNIPNNPGLELFPTVEVIDRLYPPPGLATRYPIPIELTREELELAARGAFVTRIIFVEDPNQAIPVSYNHGSDQPWMEAAPGADPLVEADRLGRPVAILRIGGRVPSEAGAGTGADTSHQPPPIVRYDSSQTCPPDVAGDSSDADGNGTQWFNVDSDSASETPPTEVPDIEQITYESSDSTFITDDSTDESFAIIVDDQPGVVELPDTSEPVASGDAIVFPSGEDGPSFDAGPEFICDDDASIGGAGVVIGDPYGPIVGPSDEYLCDGGDFFSPAGVRADWVVEGLEQEDAVAHYDTLDGRVVVVPSNRVCIYAPRFAAVRRVVNLMAHEQPQFINEMREDQVPVGAAESQPVASSLQRHAVAINRGERPATLFRQRQQAGELEQLYATMDVFNSVGAYAVLEVIRTGQVDNAEKPRLATAIESAITWTGDQAPQVVFNGKRAQEMNGLRQVGIVYQTAEPNAPRLRLVKLASRGHALPGEEVEFTLRFDNIGDQVMGNVTIVDNLSTRLEYVPGSAQSSVDANFVTEPNDAESTILRWEIKNPVKPREGGILRFRTRVR